MTDQMTFFDIGLIPIDSWQYDEDNGNVMCRCPVCEGRLLIGVYTYHILMRIYQILDAVVHVLIIISLSLASYRIRILEKEVARTKRGEEE